MKNLSLLESRRVILTNTNMLNLNSSIHHFQQKMINPKHSYMSADNTTMWVQTKSRWHVNTFLFFKMNHTFRFSQKMMGNRAHLQCVHKDNETVRWITKTKLGIFFYRRNAKTVECLQYPEQTTSILSRSGTKEIAEGNCSQPARAAYPSNINYKRECGDPLNMSFVA